MPSQEAVAFQQQLAGTGEQLKVRIPAPVEQLGAEAVGQVLITGAGTEASALAGQAERQSLQVLGVETGLATAENAPTVSNEALAGVHSEVSLVGATALNTEGAAPKSRFGTLVENGQAYFASFADPTVHKAAWKMYKDQFVAMHRAGVNGALAGLEFVPGVGKGVQLAAKPLRKVYTPNASPSTKLKTTLKAAEMVGVPGPAHLADGLSQAGHDFKQSFDSIKGYRTAQLESMRNYKAAKAAGTTPKKDLELAA